MPRIAYTSEVSARTGRTNSPMQSTNVNADAFGANIGRATQEFGAAVGQAGQSAAYIEMRETERKRNELVANEVANSDWTRQELELRNQVNPEADNLQDMAVSGYKDFVDERADAIEDNKARLEYKERMLRDLPNVSSRAAQYEVGIKAEVSQDRANQSLSTLQNRITVDPYSYDTLVQQGKDVIDARPDVNAKLKEGMKRTFEYDASKRRFDGMIQNAKTVQELDVVAAELAGTAEGARDWTDKFLPEDYKNTMDTIGSLRKAYATRNKEDARAILATLEDRNKQTVPIAAEELKEAQSLAANSEDLGIRTRMARIMRDQDIIRKDQRLPPAELRAQINAANGNPGMAYPGLPPVVSEAVNQASETFGISAGYLGGNVMTEYGAYLKPKPAVANDKFKPQVAHAAVDLRNVRSDVVAAATMAGEAYGQPLTITSGSSKAGGGTGLDISTVGMSAEEKARLAGSLIDGGFTGIGEFDGYIHADMRTSVPQNFGEKDGKFWGGWTYLSPEIVQTLKDKGFAAGATAETIKRKQPMQQDGIDYGKPTGITKNGKPTSSAVGVGQFTEGTWIATITDPNVAAVMGVSLDGVKGMSVAQMVKESKTNPAVKELLELRKNPTLSVMATAAYAAQNKKIVERTLGRNINDAELYMAHFLGSGGATTFLTAYKNNPDAIAADLMPAAAAANEGVFKDKTTGKMRTVGQIYNNIAMKFTVEPTRVAFEDNQTRQALLTRAEQGLAKDPVQYATSVGSHTVIPLDQEGGFASRGSTARAIAGYYTISMNEMKPFTEDEANSIKKQIDEGNADQSLEIMAQIQTMGDDPAKAAMKQLGVKDAVFAHAGDLYLQGEGSVAGDIIRGRQRLVENPAIEQQVGASQQQMNDAFANMTQGALFDVTPASRQAMQDAATAYYVQHAADKGKISSFNKKMYKQAVQRVIGGTDTNPAIAEVNGEKTFLPRGLDAPTMESALQAMELGDWAAMSDSGTPPRYADGTVVDTNDIKDEVVLRSIGGGKYKVALDDGTFLTNGNMTAQGRMEWYIFVPDVAKIKKLATKQSGTNVASGYGVYGGR